MQINEYINKLLLRHKAGEWAEEATLTLETLAGGYQPGQEVSFSIGGRDRTYLLEDLGKELLPGGWAQELKLLSPLAREAGRSPGKTQLFLTLTAREYEEFQEEYGGREGNLEFRPWIRQGNEFGEGGWNSNDIIQALAGLLGIKVHASLPSYWIKQFTVKPSTPLLKAILELVSPLRPILYSVQGEVFIVSETDTESGVLSDNRLSLQGVRLVKEEVKRGDPSARAGRIHLKGNLGRFRTERYKGSLSPHPFQEVQDPAGSVLISNHCYGTVREDFVTQTGSIAFADVPWFWSLGLIDADIDPDSGIVSNFSLEAVIVVRGLDVFGKATFLLDEIRITYRYRKTDAGLWPMVYSIQKTAYQHENTHGSFASPREFGNVVGQNFYPRPGRVSTLDLAIFYPYMGQVIFGLYRNLEETHTYYWYNPHGELAAQNTVTVGAVYTEDDKTFKELRSMEKEDISPNGKLRKAVLRQELVDYYQLSRDSYGVRREVMRMNREGKYSTTADVQIVQAGAVQGSPVELRKMQTYAEKGIGSDSLTEAPLLEAAVNTPSWESLETMLPLLEEGPIPPSGPQ